MPVAYNVYGLQLEVPVAGDLSAFLLPGTAGVGPRVSVRHSRRSIGASPYVNDAGAEIELPRGRWLQLDRARSTAVYSGLPLSPDQLAHPYIGPLATVFNRWVGREVFHAGAFVADDRAWVVVGQREAGKSSLLAAVADGGAAVLADDLSVTDGDHVFAGPRCLDLRRRPPGMHSPVVRARDDTRWRLLLPHEPASCRVGGWLFLRWGEELSLTVLPPSRLLRGLARHRLRTHLQSDPSILLALANRPAWVVTRPRSWDSVNDTVSSILATVAETRRGPTRIGR
jgi:hypothetical protein